LSTTYTLSLILDYSISINLLSMEITKVAFCLFLATVVMDCLPGSQETELPTPTEDAKTSQYSPAKNSSSIKGPVIIEYW